MVNINESHRSHVYRNTMTVVEIADYIGVSKDLIYKMVRQQEIPFARVGKRILFRKGTIDKWISDQELSRLNM